MDTTRSKYERGMDVAKSNLFNTASLAGSKPAQSKPWQDKQRKHVSLPQSKQSMTLIRNNFYAAPGYSDSDLTFIDLHKLPPTRRVMGSRRSAFSYVRRGHG